MRCSSLPGRGGRLTGPTVTVVGLSVFVALVYFLPGGLLYFFAGRMENGKRWAFFATMSLVGLVILSLCVSVLTGMAGGDPERDGGGRVRPDGHWVAGSLRPRSLLECVAPELHQ